ncbi:MAG: tRNA(Ile)-lysidine synthetase, partial [Candidatus Eremiobacteraeota bacterium]|nr:tRNA(Ile)-lysidine synthetase [Candidatus Eremiobacteraeota bacterium]
LLGPDRARQAIVTLARPLLSATRAELQGWLAAHPVRVSVDETNADTNIRRNAVRALLAQLEVVTPGARRNIARAVSLLRGDRTTLDRITQQAFERSIATRDKHALAVLGLRRLPRPLLRRVVRLAVRNAAGSLRDFSQSQCEAIVDAIRQARGGSYQAGVARASLSAGLLRITPSSQTSQADNAAEQSVRVRFRLVRPIETPWGVLTFGRRPSRADKSLAPFAATLFLDAARLKHMAFQVRLPKTGDTCIPAGRRSAVSLARFLAKAGIPHDRRSSVVLLCAENRIAAVLGLRAMEPYAARLGAASIAVRWQPVTNADNGSINRTTTEGAPDSLYE